MQRDFNFFLSNPEQNMCDTGKAVSWHGQESGSAHYLVLCAMCIPLTGCNEQIFMECSILLSILL